MIKKLCIAISGILIIFFGLQIVFSYKLQSQESLKIYDRHGELLYDVREEYRQTNFYMIDDVPETLKSMLLRLEDQNFYRHFGISGRSLGRAARHWMQEGSLQGASTIDQQAIKLSQQAFGSRTLRQKIKENILAININIHYSKDEILLYYINHMYFPHGVRGYETACQTFFEKSCTALSQGELLYLYEKSKFPNKHSSPEYLTNLAQHLGREDYHKEDFVGIAKQDSLHVEGEARHFVEYVLASNPVGEEIWSSFDLEIYEKIDGILQNYRSHVLAQNAQEACIIVLEEGEIVSMNTLSPYGEAGSYINPCLVPRQVGSSIKPFLYTLAFANLDYSADMTILDEKIIYSSEYGNYSPQNFDLTYHGEVSLAEALGNSLNIPAVKLLAEVGVDHFYHFLAGIGQSVGTQELRDDDVNHFGLSLALGSKEISPLDFASMRQMFSPTYCRQNNFCTPYLEKLNEVRTILSQNQNRLISFPQHSWFDIPGVYSKSGTSRHFVDARICGGDGKYTICARAGNLNMEQMLAGGHDVMGPIWYQVRGSLRE